MIEFYQHNFLCGRYSFLLKDVSINIYNSCQPVNQISLQSWYNWITLHCDDNRAVEQIQCPSISHF